VTEIEYKGIDEFKELIPWVELLRDVNDQIWTTPIALGKWSIQGIISHIMLWDKYFLENAIIPINKHSAITIQELDFDEFNKNAMQYGRTQTREDLVQQTIHYRVEILRHITTLSDEDYLKEYPNFFVPQYIIDFVAHDNHHREQIESFLSGLK
jgi:uncharacterized damage-inducible protein DinB